MSEENKLSKDSFDVLIMVTDKRVVSVDADNKEKAVEKVKRAWENDEIDFDEFENVKVDFDTEEPVNWKAKFEKLDEEHHILMELICEDDLEEFMRQTEKE